MLKRTGAAVGNPLISADSPWPSAAHPQSGSNRPKTIANMERWKRMVGWRNRAGPGKIPSAPSRIAPKETRSLSCVKLFTRAFSWGLQSPRWPRRVFESFPQDHPELITLPSRVRIGPLQREESQPWACSPRAKSGRHRTDPSPQSTSLPAGPEKGIGSHVATGHGKPIILRNQGRQGVNHFVWTAKASEQPIDEGDTIPILEFRELRP